MTHLIRHCLVHVRPEVLTSLADQASTPHEHAGLKHWATHQLPLVVTRQACPAALDHLSLGLPLPLQWGRLRLGLTLPRTSVLACRRFPRLTDVAGPQGLQLQHLVTALGQHDLHARVYGSYGWQTLSGLTYVHEASDLDVLIRVGHPAQADRAAEALAGCGTGTLKLDGELMFPDGSAVAWREWAAWRSGATSRYLVKTLQGAHLAASLPEPAALSVA